MRRDFELRDGRSDKFWSIELDGTVQTVRFGRTGTKGQTKTKDFSSEEEAVKASEKLIAQKTAKGYLEVGAAPRESRIRRTLEPDSPGDPLTVVYATAILSELGRMSRDEDDDDALGSGECKIQLPEDCDELTSAHEAFVGRIEAKWATLVPRMQELLWDHYDEVFKEEMEAFDDPELWPVAQSADELPDHFACDTLILGSDGKTFGIWSDCAWDEEHGLGIRVKLGRSVEIEVGSHDDILDLDDDDGEGSGGPEEFAVDVLFTKHARRARGEPRIDPEDMAGVWRTDFVHDIRVARRGVPRVHLFDRWTLSTSRLKVESLKTQEGKLVGDGQVREHEISIRGVLEDRVYFCKVDDSGDELPYGSTILRIRDRQLEVLGVDGSHVDETLVPYDDSSLPSR